MDNRYGNKHNRKTSWYVCCLVFGLCASVLMSSQPGFAKKRYRAPKRYFPHGCEANGFEIKGGQLVISPLNQDTEQTLVFFHNVASSSVHLKYISPPNVYFKEHWESRISPNRWTVLAVNKNNMHFQCRERYSRQQWDIVDCADVLKQCQYPRVKFASHNGGTYWVSENKSRRAARNEAIKTGILLRW